MLRTDYAEAFETGYGATRRFLLARGAPLEEAEEIAQAAWARGWEFREQLRDPGLVSYWVNSIARNLFRARFRAPIQTEIEDGQRLLTRLIWTRLKWAGYWTGAPNRTASYLNKACKGIRLRKLRPLKASHRRAFVCACCGSARCSPDQLNLSLPKEVATSQ